MDLAQLIQQFACENENLRDPAEAYNQCRAVTHRFCSFLRTCGYTGDLVDVSWVYQDGQIDGPKLPARVREVFLRGHHLFLGHTVALVGGEVYVDFTARQFDPESNWPLLWTYPGTAHIRNPRFKSPAWSRPHPCAPVAREGVVQGPSLRVYGHRKHPEAPCSTS